MDISYLLFLQDFRNGSGAFLAPFMKGMTDLAVSYWMIAIICMLYWAVDRRGGKRIIFSLGLGILMNGFLKLTFCVYRPWIREASIIPYGNAKVSATGYSFPSGHSTWATCTFGNFGIWFYQHGKKIVAAIMLLAVFTVMFSRNYLGVHTPQDVVVGFLSSLLMIFTAYKIEAWTDKDISRDKIVMVGGILLCIVLALYYEFKSYPLTYLADGSLLVDPNKMKIDSYQGLGYIIGYVVARYFERRGFAFDTKVSRVKRVIIGLVALIPLAGIFFYLGPVLIATFGKPAGKLLEFACFMFYTLLLVPNVMKLLADKK